MAIQVAPENVVGRDQLIERIWRKLRKHSIRFTAERRVGKTTVMTKMTAEPNSGFEVLFLELEGIDSADRFTELLINRVRPLLSTSSKAKKWWDDFVGKIGGTEVAGILKLPNGSKIGWQNTLSKTLEALAVHQNDRKVVLFMDELPYMLQKIGSRKSDENLKTTALTLLDTLRSVREQHKNIRMVFAGSVGLHHVVTDLKQGFLASEPLNDMKTVEIRSLSESDAITLTTRLLRDEGVALPTDTEPQILKELVQQSDCVPFYIEAVCSRLGELDGSIDSVVIRQTIQEQLASDHDPWEMEHFRERLRVYYSGFVEPTDGNPIPAEMIARSILDSLAFANQPLSIEDVWSVTKSQFPIADRQHIVQMLKSLALDHYLVSNLQKQYSFRFPLIQTWWKMAQGLN